MFRRLKIILLPLVIIASISFPCVTSNSQGTFWDIHSIVESELGVYIHHANTCFEVQQKKSYEKETSVLEDNLRFCLDNRDLFFLINNWYLYPMVKDIDPVFAKKAFKEKVLHNYFDDETRNNPLILAITNDNIEAFQKAHSFLDEDFVINKKNNQAISLMELAAVSGSINIFKVLFMRGYAIDYSVAKYAIAGGCHEIIHMCISSGVSVFSPEAYKISVEEANFDLANWIFDIIEESNDKTYLTNLFINACLSSSNIIAISCLADFSCNTAIQNRIFKHALSFSNTCMVKNLFALGAKHDVKNIYGKTFLIMSVCAKNIPIAKALIDSGECVNFVDDNGRSPLYWSIKLHDEKMESFLISRNADVNGDGALQLSVFSRDTRFAKNLLENGANPDTLDRHGQTMFMKAIKSSNFAMAELFLKFGADINFLDRNSESILFWAVEKHKSEAVKFLLLNKANVNIMDPSGKSILARAISLGELSFTEQLLNNSAKASFSGLEEITEKKVSRRIIMDRIKVSKFLSQKGLYLNRVKNLVVLLKRFNASDGQILIERLIEMGKLDIAEIFRKYAL